MMALLTDDELESLRQWASTQRLFDPGRLLIALYELRQFRSGAHETESAAALLLLHNLLARIHRDGGHHTEAVGLAQSVADADAAVVGWLELANELAHADAAIVRLFELNGTYYEALRRAEALDAAHNSAQAAVPALREAAEIALIELDDVLARVQLHPHRRKPLARAADMLRGALAGRGAGGTDE